MAEGVLWASARRPRLSGLRAAVPLIVRAKFFAFAFLVALPAPMYAFIVARAVSGDRRGSDFLSFWQAGRVVLHGHSPYPLLDALPAVADRLTFEPFVYPAPAAYWMVPLAILPFALAKTLFLVLNVGSIVVALRFLDVRDWRCHAAAFASVPVVAGTALGSFSPLLLLAAAAAWRYRDRSLRVGLIVAVLVVAKLFLWPLWLWLVYTRRFAAAVLSAAVGVTATVAAWWAIGFAGLHEYPRLLSRLTELVGTNSYSSYALIHAAGLSGATTQRLLFAGGAVLVVLAAWRFRAVRTDERSFVAALGIALLLTPILWPHYLVLLYIPISLLRRTFSALWFMPLLMWIDGNGWSFGEPIRIVPFLILCAVPFVLVLRRPPAAAYAGSRDENTVALA
jgi:glycosyl transferase family 87